MEGRVERQGVCVEVCVSPVFPCFENINKIRVWRQYKCMSLCVDSKVSSVYLLALIESFPSSLFKQFFFSLKVLALSKSKIYWEVLNCLK